MDSGAVFPCCSPLRPVSTYLLFVAFLLVLLLPLLHRTNSGAETPVDLPIEFIEPGPEPQTFRIHWHFKWGLGSDVDAAGLGSTCLFSRTRFVENADYALGAGPDQSKPLPAGLDVPSVWFYMESAYSYFAASGFWGCKKFCKLDHFLWLHPNRYNFTMNYHWPSNASLRASIAPAQKQKRILLMMSNCRSSRMNVVKRLIPEELVDYCGSCSYGSKVDCPTRGSGDFFPMELAEKYRYMVVLENVLCPHYHTEKVLRAFYAEAIPLLWDASRYAPDYELQAGLFYDLSSPNASKEDLRRFIEEDDLSRPAPGWRGIRLPNVFEVICRYVEQLFLHGNASSQTGDCMQQCNANFQCKNYPSNHFFW